MKETEINISNGTIDFMDIPKEDISKLTTKITTTLKRFIDSYKNGNFFLNKPMDLHDCGVNEEFLIVWGAKSERSNTQIDIWYAKGLNVSGLRSDPELNVKYLRIGILNSNSLDFVPAKLKANSIGNRPIPLNLEVILPLVESL